MRSPASSASSSGRSTASDPPSPSTKPSARLSNGRHNPAGDSAPTREKPTSAFGVRFTNTPPTRAALHEPARRWLTASCIATSADEQAASTANDGPPRSSSSLTVAGAMLSSEPAIENDCGGSIAALAASAIAFSSSGSLAFADSDPSASRLAVSRAPTMSL